MYTIENITNKILQGDCLAELKKMPDECVDCIITSPPYYGLRDYGVKGQIGLEKTLNEYLDKMLLITNELKRVLKKSGTMFWNHGDSYSTKPVGNFTGNAIYYKGRNLEGHKTSGQIDKTKSGIPEKCLMLQAHRLAIRMIDEQQWILRNQIIWYKPNCMPSSVKDRFTVDYEPVFFFTKAKKYWFEPQFEKADYDDRNDTNYKGGLKDMACGAHERWQEVGGEKVRNKRCVWKMEELSAPEASWLAALIDGEGWLGVNVQKTGTHRNKTYFRPRLEIGMRHRIMLDRCASITGRGTVYAKEKTKEDIYTWSVSGKEIVEILSQIYPYLFLKRKQAELLIELAGLNQTGRNQFSEDISYKRREEICEEIKWLNQSKFVAEEHIGRGSLWRIPTQPFSEAHFAVFPEKLVETPIKAGCPDMICKVCGKAVERIFNQSKWEKHQSKGMSGLDYKGSPQYRSGTHNDGLPFRSENKKIIGINKCDCKAGWTSGIVLDPFAGAGTTLLVAQKLRKNFIGIELNPEYISIGRNRLSQQVLI